MEQRVLLLEARLQACIGHVGGAAAGPAAVQPAPALAAAPPPVVPPPGAGPVAAHDDHLCDPLRCASHHGGVVYPAPAAGRRDDNGGASNDVYFLVRKNAADHLRTVRCRDGFNERTATQLAVTNALDIAHSTLSGFGNHPALAGPLQEVANARRLIAAYVVAADWTRFERGTGWNHYLTTIAGRIDGTATTDAASRAEFEASLRAANTSARLMAGRDLGDGNDVLGGGGRARERDYDRDAGRRTQRRGIRPADRAERRYDGRGGHAGPYVAPPPAPHAGGMGGPRPFFAGPPPRGHAPFGFGRGGFGGHGF